MAAAQSVTPAMEEISAGVSESDISPDIDKSTVDGFDKVSAPADIDADAAEDAEKDVAEDEHEPEDEHEYGYDERLQQQRSDLELSPALAGSEEQEVVEQEVVKKDNPVSSSNSLGYSTGVHRAAP